MSENCPQQVSAVDAKLARIEELSAQIAQAYEGLENFWRGVASRLAVVALEVWCDELLEAGSVLVFDEETSRDPEGEPTGARGLQLGFAQSAEIDAWDFVVRPAHLRQGATLYTQLEHPEPQGRARLLAAEPPSVKISALHQLPELLDAVLGSQNDTLAVVRTALGEPAEAHAMVASPFGSRGKGRPVVVPLGGFDSR